MASLTGHRLSRAAVRGPRERDDRRPAASYAEVFLHPRHDLGIGEVVGGLDLDNGLRRRHGSAEPFLEFQLRRARSEDQECLRCPQVIDNLVVVALEAFSVP